LYGHHERYRQELAFDAGQLGTETLRGTRRDIKAKLGQLSTRRREAS
jgi:hypothetical protein